MRKNEKGFTLVELIVVIAIVAILASVAIVGYTQFINNARKTKAQSELDQIYNVMYADAVLGVKLNAEGEVAETGEAFVVELTVDKGKLIIAADSTEVEGVLYKAALDALKARYEINEAGGFAGDLTLVTAAEDAGTDKMQYELGNVTATRDIVLKNPEPEDTQSGD